MFSVATAQRVSLVDDVRRQRQAGCTRPTRADFGVDTGYLGRASLQLRYLCRNDWIRRIETVVAHGQMTLERMGCRRHLDGATPPGVDVTGREVGVDHERLQRSQEIRVDC